MLDLNASICLEWLLDNSPLSIRNRVGIHPNASKGKQLARVFELQCWWSVHSSDSNHWRRVCEYRMLHEPVLAMLVSLERLTVSTTVSNIHCNGLYC